MPKCQQDHGGIAMPVAIVASRLHQAFDLALREEFAGTVVGVW
jgi:hypothetical protein